MMKNRLENMTHPQIQDVFVHTQDNHRISLLHYKKGHRKVIILAHGFFNNKDVYLFREMFKKLGNYYDVIAFDFRGHGKSSGFFSWTTKERADLQVILTYIKDHEYESIGLMGFSLGAAVSLIEAAHNKDIKTVVSVSSPYDFWKIDYRFWEKGMMEDLKLNLGYKGKGKGVLPGNPLGPKIIPLNIVHQISPRPVLFIHGSEDWLINVRHGKKLYAQAKEPKKLEIIQGGGHAEKLFDDKPEEFMTIVLKWFKDNL